MAPSYNAPGKERESRSLARVSLFRTGCVSLSVCLSVSCLPVCPSVSKLTFFFFVSLPKNLTCFRPRVSPPSSSSSSYFPILILPSSFSDTCFLQADLSSILPTPSATGQPTSRGTTANNLSIMNHDELSIAIHDQSSIMIYDELAWKRKMTYRFSSLICPLIVISITVITTIVECLFVSFMK